MFVLGVDVDVLVAMKVLDQVFLRTRGAHRALGWARGAASGRLWRFLCDAACAQKAWTRAGYRVCDAEAQRDGWWDG